MKLATYLFVVLIFIVESCDGSFFNHQQKPVARVSDKYLYFSDVEGLIPNGISTNDSLAFIQTFIENWIKNQLLLQKAEENLTSEQKDFTRLLDDYRNSLIIYRYESELIQQNLDTNVTDKEIESYYFANQKDFELKDNILQLVYVKTESKSPKNRIVRKLVKSSLENDRDSLTSFCLRHGLEYEIIDHNWITFDEIRQRIPISTYNPEVWLANNKFVQLGKDSYTYYVHILDYRLSDGISPLNFERSNIRSVILNNRKKQLIKTMRKEIYDQAVADNVIEYFKN